MTRTGRLTLFTLLGALLIAAKPKVAAQTNLIPQYYPSGSTIVLTGTPNAGEGTQVYQWLQNGVGVANSPRITGAATTLLTIRDAIYDDTGLYQLLNTTTITTTNFVGITNVIQTSNNFVTNIVFVPQITSTNYQTIRGEYDILVVDQPSILRFDSTLKGDDIQFTVKATGGSLRYQWYWQGQPLEGATNSTLSFTNADLTANAGYYSVRISNPIGQVATPPPGILFIKPASAGTYQGIFFDRENPSAESAGSFQFTLSASRKNFTGKLNIAGKPYRFTGTFSPSHEVITTSVPVQGGESLTMSMQLLTTGVVSQVVGTVESSTWSVPLRGTRLTYSSRNPTSAAGKYTMAMIPPLTGMEEPNGSGFSTIQVGTGGGVNFSGRVADGTLLKATSSLMTRGEIPVYAPLYNGTGFIAGWISLEALSSSNLTSLLWYKPPGSGPLYPNGFTQDLVPVVSSFVTAPNLNPWPPSPVVNVLPFADAVATMGGGDMFQDDIEIWAFVKVNVPRPNVLHAEKSTEDLKLSVDRGSGILTGSFIDTATGLPTPIKGIILQQQGVGYGYFLSAGTAGSFSLTASAP